MKRSCFAFLLLVWLGHPATGQPAVEPPPAEARQLYIGVDNRSLSREEAERLGFDRPTGVLVFGLTPGAPAEQAGLRVGDVIFNADGRDLEGPDAFGSLREAVAARQPGERIRLRILRDGRLGTVHVAVAARPDAGARARPQSPLRLVLDPGGHTGQIKRLLFTSDRRYLLSAGYDKTMRIWDWRQGTLERIVRVPSGIGADGHIYAMALSPDDRLAALAGYSSVGTVRHQTDYGLIRIIELATGRLVRVLRGHDSSVQALSFSPDGRSLLSGGHDQTAILWDMATGAQLRRLVGHRHHIYAAAFTPDGQRAVTASLDRTLMLWDTATGRAIAVMERHADKIYTLAVSPQDGTIASAGFDGQIRLWSGTTGAALSLPGRGEGFDSNLLGRIGGGDATVGNLQFSPDGRSLLATCVARCEPRQRVWDVATGAERAPYHGHDSGVLAAAIADIADGRVIAATAGSQEHEIRLWELASAGNLPRSDAVGSPGGREPLVLAGAGRAVSSVGFSHDGLFIGWGYVRNSGGSDLSAPEFRLRLPGAGPAGHPSSLGQPEPIGSEDSMRWVQAEVRHEGWSLATRQGGGWGLAKAVIDIRRDGAVVASIPRGSRDGYEHNSYTVLPGGSRFVSGGSNGKLIAYDLQGRALAEFVGHEATVQAVSASSSGLLVSASADQTVRLWSLAPLADADVVPTNPEEALPPKKVLPIVSLFHGRDGEWVMWTPQGYYTGSPGADRLIGWQLDKGLEQMPDYFEAAQLRRRFYRPDIVDKALRLGSADAAVSTSPGAGFKVEELIRRQPPRIDIMSPVGGQRLTGGAAILTFRLEAATDPVKRIAVRVNGRVIEERPPRTAGGEELFNVPLAEGANTITIVAGNDVGDTTREVRVTHAGEGLLDRRGTLYIVAVGVDEYQRADARLKNLVMAGRDAETFASVMGKALGRFHGKVDAVVLSGEPGRPPPTAANVRDALSRVHNIATQNDTVVVFAAGHGINVGFDYMFLPADAERQGGGWRGSTVLPWVELERIVFGTKGRRFLFVDTCHSAGAYNDKLGNEAFHNDVTAFTATGQDELAAEIYALKQGVFTYAIAQGLGPDAKAVDADRDGLVRVGELARYLTDAAPRIIDRYYPDFEIRENARKPRPRLFRARDAGDHVLARVE